METLILKIEKFKPMFEKVSRNKYLKAIRDGFMSAMPVVLFSSIFMLLAYVPNIFGFYWPKEIEAMILKPYNYSMGILGVILLEVIYLFILGYGIFYWLFNKKVRSFLNSSLLLSEGFILFAAFYAGNVLEYLSATLVMAFILGFLLQNIRYSRYPENIF